MPWWTWLALGVLALSLLATAVFTAVAVTRLKRLAFLAEAIRVQLDELARAGEELERRLAHAEERAAEFEQHRAQLDSSLARLSVLTSALSEARGGITRLQKAYLRK
jgi:septal ring factor EnvC (AmiA/AmiB activator)